MYEQARATFGSIVNFSNKPSFSTAAFCDLVEEDIMVISLETN